MKRHLLFAMLCIVGALNVSAQRDVTSQYITNATLANGLTGWTNNNFNTPQQGNNTVGYASESYAGWGNLDIRNYSLKQTITLPAGSYTLVNYSFFRQGLNADTDPTKSLAYLFAGNVRVPVKTLGSITAAGYANSQAEGADAFDSKMYRNTVDFTIDSDNTSIEIGLDGTFDLKQSWMIAGMFELINNDIPATLDSPYDVTGLMTNSGFEYRNMEGWALSEDEAFGTQNNNQSFKVGGWYAEKWQPSASGALTERHMSQTLYNLPAGYYKLTVNMGGDGTYVDLNDTKAEWTSDGNYTVLYKLSENEDLTIKAGKTAEGTANWIHFDNFKLYYCGDIKEIGLDDWQVTENDGSFHINTWSGEGNTDGSNMTTPFIELWKGSGNILQDAVITYTLNDMTPGYYSVSGLIRALNEAGNATPEGVFIYANDNIERAYGSNASICTNGVYGTPTVYGLVGQDGILKIGIKIIKTNVNWVSFKNFLVSYVGTELNSVIATNQTEETRTFIATQCNAAVEQRTAVQNVETTLSDDNYTNAGKKIEAAYRAQDLDLTAWNKMKKDADDLVNVSNDAPSDNDNLSSAIQSCLSVVNNATETQNQDITPDIQASVDNATENLKSAMITYVGAANPVGENAKFNLTFMLTNPDLTKYNNGARPNGWFTDQQDGNFQVMRNNDATSEDGTKTVFFEYWTWNAKANDTFSLYTKVTLPEGTYDMSCYAYAQDQGHDGESKKGVYFYVNDTQGSLVDNARLAEKNVEFVQSNSQPTEVKVGLKSMNPNTYNWMGIGYVELYKVPAKTYEINEYVAWDATTKKGAGDVTLTRTISADNINTLVLPFSMTAAEVAEYFGEGSKVYVVGSYANDNIVLTEKANGISANQPVLLKATVASTAPYEIPARTIVSTQDPSTTVDGVQFTGVYTFTEGKERFEVPANSYIVSSNKFIKVSTTGDAVLKCTRAYFTLPDAGEGEGVKALTFSFDDGETTGIATVEDGQLNILTGKVFDLSGREVKNPAKGLYIIDGKKVYIK